VKKHPHPKLSAFASLRRDKPLRPLPSREREKKGVLSLSERIFIAKPKNI
jgi:hypothetical protein